VSTYGKPKPAVILHSVEKETDSVSESDSVHGSVLQKTEKQNSGGCKCTTLHLPAGALVAQRTQLGAGSLFFKYSTVEG